MPLFRLNSNVSEERPLFLGALREISLDHLLKFRERYGFPSHDRQSLYVIKDAEMAEMPGTVGHAE
jgi:hypothetical protein